MNVSRLMARLGVKTKVAAGVVALAGLAIVAVATVGVDRAVGQPGGPSVGGGGGVRAAAPFTNAGSTALCAQAAFDSDDADVAPALFNGNFAIGQGTVVSTAPYAHNCTGNVEVTFSARSIVTATSTTFVRITATCTGGGCVVGTAVLADPNTPRYIPLDNDNDNIAVGQGDSTSFTFLFPNLPRGRYTINAETVSFPAAGATVGPRTLVVKGFGPPTPALP